MASEPLNIDLEFTREREPEDLYRFQYGRQRYQLRLHHELAAERAAMPAV